MPDNEEGAEEAPESVSDENDDIISDETGDDTADEVGDESLGDAGGGVSGKISGAGEAVSGKVSEVGDTAEKAGTAAAAGVGKAGVAAQEAGESAAKKVGEFGDKAEGKIESAAEKVGNVAGEGAQEAVSEVGSSVGEVRDSGKKGLESLSEQAGKIGETGQEGAESLTKEAGDVGDASEELVDSVTDELSEVAKGGSLKDVKEAAVEGAKVVAKEAREFATEAKRVAQELADQAQEFADRAKKAGKEVGDKLGAAGGAIKKAPKEIVDSARDKLGSLTGGSNQDAAEATEAVEDAVSESNSIAHIESDLTSRTDNPSATTDETAPASNGEASGLAMHLTQENRQAVIETPLSKDVFLLQNLVGSEALSEGFHYSLNVLAEDPAFDGNTLIGKRISVTYHDEDGRTRFFNGFVSRFEYLAQVDEPVKATSYQITMISWIWFLQHSADCQAFQELTAPDIVKKVFGDLGFNDFRDELTENYRVREFCVQYNETALNFVSRLMEEEGIFYYFEHTKDKHTLVLCDSTAGYFDVEESEVAHGTGAGQGQFKQLGGWRQVYEFRPGNVVQKDFNFKKPSDSLDTKQKSKVKFDGNSSLEIFEYPGGYEEGGDGDRLTRVRLEEIEAEHDSVSGSGSYLNFTPGGKFEVHEHARPGVAGNSYTLVEVQTEINSNLGFQGQAGDDFANSFRCIPATTVYRPPRTSWKPVMDGPQTAVVATDGQEIVVDEHARVKVQFHWDRYGKNDINSSCWIRVSQVHAGKGWGMMDIPRRGEEVIVSFLDGDPDRPIITGRVYNGDNPPPFGLKGAGDNAKNKTRRGNMTKSYEAEGYNEMTMDDTEGEEQIRIHGQYNMDTTVQNDQTVAVNNNRTKTIAVDETNSIGNNRSTTVGVNHGEVVGVDQSITIGKDQSLSIGNSQQTMVAISSTESIGVSKLITAGESVATATGGSISESAGRTMTTDVGKEYSISVGDKFSIVCGSATFTMEKSGKITLKGSDILVKGTGKIVAKASGDMVLKAAKMGEN